MTVKVIRAFNPNATLPGQQDWRQTDDVMTLNFWDPNWQGTKILNPSKPVKVYPGDRLETTCIYDSVGRDAPIQNGEGFMDEMCIPFITYYPVMNIPWCTSLGLDNEAGVGALCNAGVGNNPSVPVAPSDRGPVTWLPEDPSNCIAP